MSRVTLTRKTQQPDVIYVTGAGVFVSPDGEGRYWYESVAEAQAQHGDDLPVRIANVDPYEV